MSSSTSGPRLRGRRTECETLDGLLRNVRAGQSRVLVVRGEAGTGKTAMLEYLRDRASGCRVATASGVEAEMELPFAGLHQLCAPMLDHLERLPSPQRDALRTAFGLGAGDTPDRFLVALATLSVLAEVAEERPLICLVDDVQWLDTISVQTLAFVARRLLAESVALVFALREPADQTDLAGIPDMVVRGLGDGDARALLDAAIPGRLDERVRDRILAEARGNPLALLELHRGMAPADLAGGFGLDATSPLMGRVEDSFLRRVRSLPAETQRLMLVAAAEPVGDATVLWRAAERLGIALTAASPATAAGLIDVGARVGFRHPLVRSAVYRGAQPAERQEAHGALAAATDPDADPDRRAWHRAHATVGTDEAVAEELERSAGRARARGGVAAAAAFLERATALTSDPARRGARALAAAQAKFESAAPEAALRLVAIAEMCPLDDLQHARLARLHAEIAFALRRGSDAPPLLLDAARRLEGLDPAAARETHLQAIGAAVYAGRLSAESGVRRAAEAARAAPAAPAPRPIDRVLDGMARRFTEGPAAGVPSLRRALEAFRDEPLEDHEATMRWLLLCPVVQSMAVFELWDDDAFRGLATRAVRLARDAGALTTLPVALTYSAGVPLFGGEFAAAAAVIEEADAISAATGNAPILYARLLLCAWRGDEAEAREVIEAGTGNATARGEGRVLALAGYATAVLSNGLGRYEAAIDGAMRGSDDDDQGYAGPSLAELVEAATRAGRPELADSAMPRLEERTRAAGTDWALGILARSRALTTGGGAADALHREAIERLGRTGMRVELARARLLYGEWLRREDRRVDAREHLRAAHEMLTLIGAEAFAERARRELVATGEVVRRHVVATRDDLTAQELQVALLADEGLTNRQIGAELFLSPRTVEWHLGNVFAKLGIGSRRELHDALPERPRAVA
ncbi:MAG TPA: BREX system ATP-binding domain-containing protein [Miltoncostaeaceae bacterium]|nr:BREX system ATP-binding domain-containing protein [Miltoncostaeaceae bacterium]